METARRALVYLACTQKPDGGFAQNFWVDGRPYWSGEQLDEVAFPIILAWRLWKANGLGELAARIAPPVAIGDRVWLDANGNGVQDAGEPGLPNACETAPQASRERVVVRSAQFPIGRAGL